MMKKHTEKGGWVESWVDAALEQIESYAKGGPLMEKSEKDQELTESALGFLLGQVAQMWWELKELQDRDLN